MSKENQKTEEISEAIQLVSAETKNHLKTQHGDKLRSLLLPLDDEGEKHLEVLAIVPDRSVVGQHQKYILTDPKKSQEVLVKACIKTSKDEVMADDALFYAAYSLISDLIPIRQGKFGKV